MAIQVLDSHLRCPRDGKRLVVQVGQDDLTGEGDMRAVHECWHCGYREEDRAWSRPLRTDGQSIVERREERQRGVEVPMDYDRAPVSAEEALAAAEAVEW